MTLLLEQHPNDVAVELTGRPYLSHSSVSTYQSCPLKWHFRYRLGLPEAFVSSSLVFGGAIHQAVELHFRERMAGNPPPGLDELLYEYQAAWSERDLNAVKFGKGEDVDSLGQLAERVLVSFQESPLANPEGRILGVEEELTKRIAANVPDLLARIDLLVEEDDALVITDLKTSRSRWSQQQAEDSAEQLLLYAEAAEDLCPDKPVKLQFVVVTKTKTPSVEAYRVELDRRRIARTKRVIQRTWRAMQSGLVYPAPSAMSCGGCPFRGPCQDWPG